MMHLQYSDEDFVRMLLRVLWGNPGTYLDGGLKQLRKFLATSLTHTLT
jgi:hypothetical protein